MTAMPLTISEAAFQSAVIDLAKLQRWRVCHFRAAPTISGRYATPVQGHPGVPDLILARDGVVVLAELKSQSGRATPAQRDWLRHLGGHGRLWKPSDWDEIEATLKGAG